MKARDLRKFPLLADLTEDELVLLTPLLERKELAAGRRILREGDPSEGLVLLAKGRARVETKGGESGELVAPASLGAAALASVGARELTVTAEEPSEAWFLSRTAFHRFAEDAPRAAVRLLEAVVAQLAALLREGVRIADES